MARHPFTAIRRRHSPIGFAVLLPALLAPLPALAQPASCTYTSYKWNVNTRQAAQRQTVRHAYDRLGEHEVDPLTGCTVCEEDQREIRIQGLPPFRLCRLIAHDVEHTLQRLLTRGIKITHITGYRVGMTRGDVDRQGNRSRFSNHSFGIALDINPQSNGLYDRCLQFGPHCRLIRGGPWQAGRPGSLTAEGPTVRAMKALGFEWGGEIPGRQKDFMHFSPTGY